MKYFKVTAKCGHVGRNNYIVKDFYVIANDGESAAYKVRYLPRVKHDRKDAILFVERISKTDYFAGKERNKADLYFCVHSSSEQRRCGAVDYEAVIVETKPMKRKRERNAIYYNKRERIARREVHRQLTGEM